MLRPNLPIEYQTNQKDLIFQIIDWKSCDLIDESEVVEEEEEEEDEEEERTYKRQPNRKKLYIRGYGVTENGNSISVLMSGFQPYFYFRIPQEWGQTEFNYFTEQVKWMVEEYNRPGLMVSSIVKKKEFYGFTNNELFNFGVFVFKSQASYYSYQRIFKEKKIFLKKMNVELDMSTKLYETKVTSLLRFFHVQNLDPAGWSIIKGGRYQVIPKRQQSTRCQLEVALAFNEIQRLEKNSIGKILVASFDIECVSEDGSFPKYDRPYDQVIQIGTTIYEFGNNECKYKYIATLGECLPIEGVEVECYATERDLILGWANFIARIDPDIITGYNIWGFDWEFIYKRAEIGFQKNGKGNVPYHTSLYRTLQRIKARNTGKNIDDAKDPMIKLTEQRLSSSAMGDNFLKFIDIEGVVQIDLLKYFQREEKFDSYKLDNVAYEILKERKVDLGPNELFANFKIGTPDKIREIAVYCVMDCKLVNDLVNKKQVITNNIGMANVCVVPFSFLFLRGQGIKIFSLVAKFCREENFLIKDLSPDDIDTNSYEGAIVFVPKPGIYFEPVVVMDYNSLYPSSMIAENISHDSIVGFKEYHLKPGASGSKREDFELIKDTMKTEYDNLPGYHYNEIEYELLKEDEEAKAVVGEDGKKRKPKKVIGYKRCRFAEADDSEVNNFSKKSVLPRILVKLLKARKDTRKRAEYVKHTMKDGRIEEGIPTDLGDGRIELFHVEKGKYCIQKEDVVSQEDSFTEFEQKVLDGLQLAYKVTCNSLYGQVGASTSPICFKELAACTTATGRLMVTTARDVTLKTFAGSRLTYGDSVTGETPVLLKNKKTNEVYVKEIKEMRDEVGWGPYDLFKPYEEGLSEKEQTTYQDSQIWTANGWADINRVIRHKTNKKIYRVMTKTGIVDVTEDHSLLSPSLEELKPKDVKIGTKLRHGTPFEYHIQNHKYSNNIDEQIDMKSFDLRERTFLDIQEEYISLRKKCKYVIFGVNKEDPNKISMFYSDLMLYDDNERIEIISIEEIRVCGEDEYVYDIETTDGTFQAGVGQMIVKNTDSVFINFTDHIKMNHPGVELTEKEILIKSIEMGVKAAKNINSYMKKPQNIEYEKTLWPFVIFSKKRYFGNLYEHNPEKYKPKYMGIVLKRRDNAPIVKTIYNGVLDMILNKRDLEGSKKFFRQCVQDLLEGKVDISQLIISKTLKAEYANPTQIAHKVLADKMGERDPGNKPQSNDRIPYCYMDACNLSCQICKGKVNPEKCKCIGCQTIFCSTHLVRHKEVCVKRCRFCRLTEKEHKLTKCMTCTAYYCGGCFTKHMKRTDSKTQVEYNDKCKKALTCKILQGDILEHPNYITEHKLKIDYTYYLEHQIQVPVFQIFALTPGKPESIIEDIVRKNENAKKGNHAITDWLSKMKSKPKVEEEEKVESEVVLPDKELEEVQPVEKKVKKLIKMTTSPLVEEEPVFDIKKKVNLEDGDLEELDMLKDFFEEDEDPENKYQVDE